MRVMAEGTGGDVGGFSGIADTAKRNTGSRILRSRGLAGVLAFHWFARVLEMRLADLWHRFARGRAGATVIVVLCGLALGAALALPDEAPAPSDAMANAGEVALSTPVRIVEPKSLPVVKPLPVVVQAPAPAILSLRTAETWVPVKRPIALYNLEGPETEAADFSHRVAMLGKHARQDTLSWLVRPDRNGPMARPAIHVVIERFERQPPTFRPLFADLASRAASQGTAIDRMNPASEIVTKFGALEVADGVLATEQGQLACLLFRRIDTIGFTLAGWYCGSAQRPADRVSLACFVDRLDLVSAGQDLTLKRYFAAAERRRKSCSAARQPGRRLTWLDHEAPIPALKLSARTR